MGKKKKQITIAIVLLLCIAVTTTVVLVARNSGRKQENQLADNGDIQIGEQTGDINAGHNNSEDVTLSSNIAEGKTELAEGKPSATQTSTEEAKKPTTESGNATDDNKPTGETSDTTSKPNTTQTPTAQTQTPTTQTSTTQTQTSTTQVPTTQAPSTTEQPSGGNQGGGNGGNTHQHTWETQYRTIHHDEVGHYENVCVKEAYDEPVYESRYICNYCHQAFGRDEMSHFAICGPPLSEDDIRYVPGVITTAGSSYSTGQVQVGTTHHDAVYDKKWIVDKKAYDEQVSNGYKCTTCGATK